MTTGFDIEASAAIEVQLGRVATALETAAVRDQRMQHAIMSLPIKPHSTAVVNGAVTFLSHESDLGPRTGYAWAVQRLSVGGLASGDLVTVYKGPPTALTADPTMQAQVLTNTVPTWHPGRTGFLLFPGDTIVVVGASLQATAVAISGEVIQMEQWIVPDFLL